MADDGHWGELFERGMGCLAFVGLLIWLIVVVFADSFKLREAKRVKLERAISAVHLEASRNFPTAQIRFEPRFGDNLWLYISRHHFEAVPYPDRTEVVARIGETWCSNIQYQFLLPSVSVRDIRNADKLASYNCVLQEILGPTFR